MSNATALAVVVVLSDDWDGGEDPINYYSTNPKGCLDFNSQPAKPRSVLTEMSRTIMADCQHTVDYNVVICSVKP